MSVYTGKRGMILENLIEATNRFYALKGIALVQKISTPIKVLRSGRNGTVYGTWDKKSTVDFVGTITGGQYICFDAKETNIPRLPLDKIKKHQIEHLKNTHYMGGDAFLVIWFRGNDKCYKLPYLALERFIAAGERASIPIAYCEQEGVEIEMGKFAPVNYLLIGENRIKGE